MGPGQIETRLAWNSPLLGVTDWPVKTPSFSSVFPLSPLPVLWHPPASYLLISLPLSFLTTSSSLSFCGSCHPALLYLHRGAALTITTPHRHTHTPWDTHAHHFRQPPSFSHLSTADTKHSTTPGVPALQREPLLCSRYNITAFTHKLLHAAPYMGRRHHKYTTIIVATMSRL